MDTNASTVGQKKNFATDYANPAMLQELVRLTVTRVLQDKILLGLLIVGILGIFVGGFTSNDEMAASKRHAQAQAIESPEPQAAAPAPLTPPQPAEAPKPVEQLPQQAAAPVQGALDPALATDFVKWWMTGAMDYSASSSQQNHTAAMRWMTPQAAQAFQTAYWNPEMSQGVTHGTIVAAFQPISVQAQAVNPDGTVVVGLSGNLVTQSTGRPASQQIQLDLLVRKESDGLRIAGLFNRAVSPSGAPSY